ncbi:vacuolar sorting-associated 22-like protein 1 [Chlorella sorokiniana]|uniref:Vacuolar sorting-associated 22-like protein 1 n=1 Tax=Chlorella sorokiniana TaxID=3076 RepID=A0A2P6TJG4_CHLSO|nr:vacuolar sorting-associated 22-like protein 1 [Chlorella sorokiniana]|eukprot:PRW39352.1 vacuolar sorting-associated 22-like protein 1 [Chlorella sorokiniana]
MRRRPGIAGIKATQAERGQFRAVGEAVAETQAAVMRGQMSEFKERLEEFALRHKSDIRSNPEFRAQFHAMCAHIGVDPLASNKGTWNKLLGFGDFYYELGVQVIEACITSRPFTGGLMELSLVHKYVQRRRGSKADPVSEDDLLHAIKRLQGLGSGFGVVKIGSRQFVRSMPTELSTDSNTLIELAQRLGGYFALADAVASTGWQEERVREAVTLMAREGLVLIDDQPGADGPTAAASSAAQMPLAAGSRPRPPRIYWVPAVGVWPAIEAYRQESGLASVPLPPTVDITLTSVRSMASEANALQAAAAAAGAAPAAELAQAGDSDRSCEAATPASYRTPSIAAALAAALPQQLYGVSRRPSDKTNGPFTTNIYVKRQQASITGLTQQQAAVAHDLVATWRVSALNWQHKRQCNDLNFPAAGYSQDAALMGQLRQLHTVWDMKEFLDAVLQQPPTAAVSAAPAAAAGPAAAPPSGSRKRKRRPPARVLQAAWAKDEQQWADEGPPGPTVLPLLVGRAAEAAQRQVEQAVQAFAAADRASPAGMLRPLQHLLRALDEQAGEALQEVVAGWCGYSLERQQEVFDAALGVAARGAWVRLDSQLRLALALTEAET